MMMAPGEQQEQDDVREAQNGRSVDPRVKRTRQLLQHAFFELMGEKGFADITIQDIAERATVNRATFYAHFPDKYALMDSVLREQFQRMLASRLPGVTHWSKEALHGLIMTVFDFLTAFHHDCTPADRQLDPMFEQAMQQEIYVRLVGWLKQAALTEAGRRVGVETMASVMSWAIFGTAAQWSHQEQKAPAEVVVNQILIALSAGAARLAPGMVVE